MERKRVANRLWRISSFYFLAEGVVHERNNGNFFKSNVLHVGQQCHLNSPKVHFIAASHYLKKHLRSFILEERHNKLCPRSLKYVERRECRVA